MKLGLICNQNNILFGTARHLRDRGLDVELVLLNHEGLEWPHFHPSHDTFDLDYQGWTRTVTWGEERAFSSHDFRQVERDLARYDVLVGCGSTPAYCAKVGRTLDVFVPYGSDLVEAPFNPPRFNRHSLRSLAEFPLFQRKGVRGARYVLGDLDPLIEQPLAKLDYRGTWIRKGLPMIYTPLYDPATILQHKHKSHWFHVVEEFRARVDVLLSHHARHIWKSPLPENWHKGNDMVFRGLRAAIDARPDVRFGVVAFEYGPDVLASKALVHELGLDDHVLWLPKTSRKDIMLILAVADLCCGMFAKSFISCGTVNEILALGKPMLHRFDRELFTHLYDELYPVLNVQNPQDFARHLQNYVDEPAPMIAAAAAGRTWLQANAIDGSIDKLVEVLKLV